MFLNYINNICSIKHSSLFIKSQLRFQSVQLQFTSGYCNNYIIINNGTKLELNCKFPLVEVDGEANSNH